MAVHFQQSFLIDLNFAAHTECFQFLIIKEISPKEPPLIYLLRIAESPATEKPVIWFARFISYGNKMFFQYAGHFINAWGVGYGGDMAVRKVSCEILKETFLSAI